MKSSVVDSKHLNFIVGIEKKLTDLLKELKTSEAISETNYKNHVFFLCMEFVKRGLY